jgi:hypothetical protein
MVATESEIRTAAPRFDRVGFWIAAASGTLVSLAITGFVFATNNNLFHLPIVAELYDEPQFANDGFVQCLRYYAAGPWMLLRGSARYVDPYWSFLLLFVLSRLLSFIGFLACARLFGIVTRSQQICFALLVSVTWLLRQDSFGGGGGLFIEYFTHSEIGNGLFLLDLYLAFRHRIAAAIGLVGVIFFVNAFMGVWAIVVLAVVFLAQIAHGDMKDVRILYRCGIGVGIASLFAAPVVTLILSNPDFGKPLAFDYISFLKEYYPFHFLFDSVSLRGKIGLAFVTAIGVGAMANFGKQGRLWLAALLAACAIYVVGIFMPHVTHSPTILNLHLLRSSVLIQLLSALAVCALATSWWFGEERFRARIAAPVVFVLLSVPTDSYLRSPAILALGLFLAASAFTPVLKILSSRVPDGLMRQGSRLRIAAAVWMVSSVPVLVFEHRQVDQREQAWTDEWQTIGVWARENTPVNAVFMNPVVKANIPPYTDEEVGGASDAIFNYTAHRSVWVGFKKGAAVMWSPSYYYVWHRRVSEVSSLVTHQEKLDYAQKNGLAYEIEICLDTTREKPLLFATKRICVYDVTPAADTPHKN